MVEQRRFEREERQSTDEPEGKGQSTEEERVPIFDVLASLQAKVSSKVCIILDPPAIVRYRAIDIESFQFKSIDCLQVVVHGPITL